MHARNVVFTEYGQRPFHQRMRRWHIEDADTIFYALVGSAMTIVSPIVGFFAWATWHELLYYFAS